MRPWRTGRTTQHKVRQQKVEKEILLADVFKDLVEGNRNKQELNHSKWRAQFVRLRNKTQTLIEEFICHHFLVHIRWLPLAASVNSVNSFVLRLRTVICHTL